ncbi:WD40/YVTN/BNR-like repeat-containing protein [Zunongwangia atlantica]|uniref:BNR repeat-containing glycosyl hydrolase n=1 Tax=Zunongwangia atlantica 22II14-10F7 TaxID=1185767 RepID=A0A1Y1T3J4_9FLAO|nr:oxidoreductase [Zunongwangia atlantica]ORL45608.1 BNR repeat-containing glycosyl hydrolase [Zunongwangia atlantica 22II14-10F7]
MKKVWIMALLAFAACKNDTKSTEESSNEEKQISAHRTFEKVEIESILENDSLSIRAIEVIGNNLAFAANHGTYGLYNSAAGTWKLSQQKYDSLTPEFRAIGSTANDFFMLSVANPALLYKTGDDGKMKLVYKEENEKVFYDAIAFWNDKEGIAMGDPTDDCLSIIITRDGGNSWEKINCSKLPKAAEGEAAFAASNSNIAIEDDHVWILSGGMKSRVFHSADKGENWEVVETPLVQGKPTLGGYSMDFYDAENGIIIGGNYEDPEGNTGNKAITKDGGKTWNLIADGQEPNYKSSVRYVPSGSGEEIVAAGFTGISYTKDAGKTWEKLSDEGFFTLRFLNDSTAYAAGSKRIAKLHFK